MAMGWKVQIQNISHHHEIFHRGAGQRLLLFIIQTPSQVTSLIQAFLYPFQQSSVWFTVPGCHWSQPAGNRAQMGGREERTSGYLFLQFPLWGHAGSFQEILSCQVLVTAPDLAPLRCSGSQNPRGTALSLLIFHTLLFSLLYYFLPGPFLIQRFKVFVISLQFLYFENYTI